MTTETTQAVGAPLERQVRPDVPMVERLREEADLCRNEGANDIAHLLDEAVQDIDDLQKAYALLFKAHGAERTRREQIGSALRFALTQNEHDMLMTGEELRAGRAALGA